MQNLFLMGMKEEDSHGPLRRTGNKLTEAQFVLVSGVYIGITEIAGGVPRAA